MPVPAKDARLAAPREFLGAALPTGPTRIMEQA